MGFVLVISDCVGMRSLSAYGVVFQSPPIVRGCVPLVIKGF